MVKRYLVLIGVIISMSLLTTATFVYPGGSFFDKESSGFDWTTNFISNLFLAKALNGLENPSKIWADTGMIVLSVSFAVFFINFSKKIPLKSAANIIKYLGTGSMFLFFLIVTSLHDLMVTVSSTMILISFFYITVFILKSKLKMFKFSSIFCLLLLYYSLYLYGTGKWDWLPIIQKITFFSFILLILGLEYFTNSKDFEEIKLGKQKNQATKR